MVSTANYHRKPLFWVIVLLVAAVAAYSTLQQVTFVPGVPTSGYVQAYLILLAFWFVGIVAAWFIMQLALFLFRKSRRRP
jgi:hypothetical protein